MTTSAQRRPVRTASVGYLFGVLVARAVPGTVLVPLLADLGMSTSAARTMLHRMRAAGSIEVERAGRVAVYRLAGTYLEHYRKVAFTEPSGDWSGFFHAVVYDIPETHRAERDLLREQAFAAGFAAARAGLLIGVREPERWLSRWCGRGDLLVERVRLHCDLPAARRLADRAWGLTDIAEAIDAFDAELRRTERRVERRRETGPDALARLYDVWQEFVAIRIAAPLLPEELFPDSWGMATMEARVYRVNDVLLPLAQAYAADVIERAGAAGLVEPDPETPRSESRPHGPRRT